MQTRQTIQRTPKGSKELQQVIVKYDRAKYRRVRHVLLSMDSTVASFVRSSFDDLLDRHDAKTP